MKNMRRKYILIEGWRKLKNKNNYSICNACCILRCIFYLIFPAELIQKTENFHLQFQSNIKIFEDKFLFYVKTYKKLYFVQKVVILFKWQEVVAIGMSSHTFMIFYF